MSETNGTVSYLGFRAERAPISCPPPGWFLAKSAEEIENKRVEFSRECLAIEKEGYRNQLRQLVPRATELHCKVDFEVAVGEPVEQILRVAEETKADLIVMGAKGRQSLAGNVPRTKAYRVVSGARCPVLTVRS